MTRPSHFATPGNFVAPAIKAAAVLLVGTLLAGCGPGVQTTASAPPDPAPTLSFDASPISITTGNSTTLSWSSANATACTASGAWSGPQALSDTVTSPVLNATATFSLSCSGAAGSTPASQSVTVTVTPPAQPTLTLSASPTPIPAGSSSTLTWSASNATSCIASGGWSGTKNTSGTLPTDALTTTTTYALTCAGAAGTTPASKSVTVTVTPQPTLNFTATPSPVAYGSAATLQWSTTNANSCTASGAWSGSQATSGSASTGALTGPMTYVLTCAGGAGTTSASQSVTVTVNPPVEPTITTFIATPGSILTGQSSTLTWSSNNALSCAGGGGNAGDGWSAGQATSGTFPINNLAATTIYTLSCAGAVGSTPATATLTVTVTAPPPAPTLNFYANPSTVVAGNPSTLYWTTTNASSCQAGGAWSGTQQPNGSVPTPNLTSTTQYSLVCSGAAGTTPAMSTISVTVTPRPPTLSFTASPNPVGSGSGSVLTWTANNATSCMASGGWTGTQATSGTYSTGVLSSSATYNLSCSGASGTSPAVGSVTITVNPQPSLTFTASATSIGAGGSSTLTWSTSNANACTASGAWSGNQGTSGTYPTGALSASATYSLSCSGASGTSPATGSVTITVNPQPTLSFAASPTSIAAGGTSTLTWSTSNANACTASGGNTGDGWSGSQAVSGTFNTPALSATTTYALSCTGGTGTTPAGNSVTVTVTPKPVVSLTANPTSVVSGGTTVLTWSSTNATACTASNGWSGSKPTSGSATTAAITKNTTYALTCTGPGGSNSGAANVTITSTGSFAVTPAIATLTLTQTQQFTAAVPGGGGATWTVDGIAGGNSSVGTISGSGLYTAPASAGTHTILATSIANPQQSGSAAAAVTDLAGIYTYHNDAARTGQNLKEYALTPASVASGAFAKQWTCSLDGAVYAQPLYVASLNINGGTHNVLIVATQHDSVYAIDADNPGCVVYWHTSYINAAAGVTTIPSNDTDVSCTDIHPEFGITGTPVIDQATQTMYVVAATKENGSYVQRLHALNIATGVERANSPAAIQASIVNNAGHTVTFSALWQNQRPGLALTGGRVYIGWSSHCDLNSWNGWIMSYDETSLAQISVLNTTPNGSDGSIWMSGGAPAIDSSGSLYVSTGNGTFDDSTSTLPPLAPNNDFSMSFLKLDPSSLQITDFYTPSGEAAWSDIDWDISSSGVTVLPDGIGPAAHPNLLVGSDKQAHWWVLDRSNLGHYSSVADNTVQYLTLPSSNCTNGVEGPQCVYATPAYYNNTVYVAPAPGHVLALPLVGGLFPANAQAVATPSTTSAESYNWPGPTVTISASPSGNGIAWVLDNSAAFSGNAVLRAYDAGNLGTTLYDSSKLATDTAGPAVKFTFPVIANGHVYVAGSSQLTVYGFSP